MRDMVADAPRAPLNGFADGAGLSGFPEDEGRDEGESGILSNTCRCCRNRAALSTITPGVAELRPAGVFGYDIGLCRNLSFNCCFRGGAGEGAVVDMLSFSFG
jgi:hypothetical protein